MHFMKLLEKPCNKLIVVFRSVHTQGPCSLFYASSHEEIKMANLIQLIGVLVWPTVVVIVLIVFRKPLADFLRRIAWRVTKFSITQFFSVELSIPKASDVPSDLLIKVSQELAFTEFPSDSFLDLQNAIKNAIGKDVPLGYLIVDLEKGQKWLTSRLFIFTLMLERMQGLRCVVFLGTHCNVPRSFVGIALPGEIRWALARKYPWLEKAYIDGQIDLYKEYEKNMEELRIQSKQGALMPFIAGRLVSTFLSKIQVSAKDKDHSPDPANRSEWEFLKKSPNPYWEHANWIDEARLESDLGDALHTSEEVWYKDSLDTAQVRRVQALLRRKGSFFVALVDRTGVFKSLIDRGVLLEQAAERVEKVSDD
jgi:hypothetical protein